MEIKHSKRFIKNFEKLPRKIQKTAITRIELFIQDRKHSQLRDQALSGKLVGKRSFSITGNYRIIYQEIEGEVVFLFLNIGTHAQVYE